MNMTAYKYSICGLSMMGPITKYIEIINTIYGMMIGTFWGRKVVVLNFKSSYHIIEILTLYGLG